MYNLIRAFVIVSGLVAAAGLSPRPIRTPPRALLYVADTEGDDIAVIDAYTFNLAGRITVGKHPHGAAASPDGRRVYVTVEGQNELVAIDTSTNRVIKRSNIGNRPNEPCVADGGRFVFVPLLEDSVVAVVDAETLEVVDHIKVPAMPHNTFASADGRHVYVGSMSGQRITTIDASTRLVTAEFNPGGWVRPLAIKRDESVAYAALSGLHGFVEIDMRVRRVERTVRLLQLPPDTPKPFLDTYTHGLALTPDEHRLYVTSVPGNALYVYSVPDLDRLAKINVGKAPNWIAVRPDGNVLFVSNQASDTVSVIDTGTNTVIATVPVGAAPKRIIVVEPR
ncbi:MAG TPA: YncE family protein [Blastocatellia bacterium]|nr:YncE family protein [Blastocatellia bacterium]